MDISPLSTTSDPEQLRTLAIAMVQKSMAETQNLANVVVEKDRNIADLQNRIRILEEQMMLMRISQKSRRIWTKLRSQSGDEEKTTARPVRKPLPSHLPRVEKIIQPDTDHCPECDEPLHYIRDAVSEKLEYIPAHFVVNRYVRPQYSCPCCQKVFSGEMPAHVLPKSAVEPSVIAQVVISKYTDHLPLYRQQQVFARSDVGLPRQFDG